MRFLYAVLAMGLWMFFMSGMQVSADAKFLALAIIFAGAMAGGDGK